LEGTAKSSISKEKYPFFRAVDNMIRCMQVYVILSETF
jgi:hypothetical protein